MTALALAASLVVSFPAGSEREPSAVFPLIPTSEPLAFWWDDSAFFAGGKAYPWNTLSARPENGAKFQIDFGEVDRQPVVLHGEIDLAAPRFRIGSYGQIGNADISNAVRITANRQGKVRYRFRAAGATPDYAVGEVQRKLNAGETLEYTIRQHGSSSGFAHHVIWDNDGKKVFYSDCRYRDPKLTFDLRKIYAVPESNVVHVVSDVWTDVPGHFVRLVARDWETDSVERAKIDIPVSPAWGRQVYAVSADRFPHGLSRILFEGHAPDGRLVHLDTATFYRPAGQEPWEGTALGNDDTVPPPWTPPLFGEDTFECWNRTAKFGGDGLVASITSGGRELLSEPVSVLVDGRPLSFAVTGVSRRRSEATYLLKALEADVLAEVKCEFDGYMAFALTHATTAGRIELRVAVKRSAVNVFDDCAGGVGAKEPLSRCVGRERVFSVMERPWWWMIGYDGLMGGVLSMKGFRLRNIGASGRMTATDDAAIVTTTLLDTPDPHAKKRTARFYLSATPVKPRDPTLANFPQEKMLGWTGYMYKYYEAKYPGFEDVPKFLRFQREIEEGVRVFFYNGTRGASPESPFWAWYGVDWGELGVETWMQETPLFGDRRFTHNWAYGCPNSRSFLENKVWGVDCMLNRSPAKGAKDLYFDLSNPGRGACENTRHGCVWKDEFGNTIHENSMAGMREILKRSCRIVKEKNADGLMYGHVTSSRTPADSFFAITTMGENFDGPVYRNGLSYREVFTPEVMQTLFVPRTREMMIIVEAQFERTLNCHEGDAAARAFDWTGAKMLREFRHFAAYSRIHGLTIGYRGMLHGVDTFRPIEQAIGSLGGTLRHSAYYMPGDESMSLSVRSPRILWAVYSEDGGSALVILLNDTDKDVVENATLKNLKGAGRDVIDGTRYDFSDGSCQVGVPARDAKFIWLSREGRCIDANSDKVVK